MNTVFLMIHDGEISGAYNKLLPLQVVIVNNTPPIDILPAEAIALLDANKVKSAMIFTAIQAQPLQPDMEDGAPFATGVAEMLSMNAPAATLVPTIAGTPYAGGFYVGQFHLNGQPYALVRAPRAEGHHPPTVWNSSSTLVEDAESYNDGLANTNAMSAAGSNVAKWARSRDIGGFDDWYIPSQDELEMMYRALKPGTGENACCDRSGMNLSAIPPTRPYTPKVPGPKVPGQTVAMVFRKSGPEAFDESWYWSSTQSAADDDFAWCQYFDKGFQVTHHKLYELPVFLVRRVLIRQFNAARGQDAIA